jgi:hypothetical protein
MHCATVLYAIAHGLPASDGNGCASASAVVGPVLDTHVRELRRASQRSIIDCAHGTSETLSAAGVPVIASEKPVAAYWT